MYRLAIKSLLNQSQWLKKIKTEVEYDGFLNGEYDLFAFLMYWL